MKVNVSECLNKLQTFISFNSNVAMHLHITESCLCFNSSSFQ